MAKKTKGAGAAAGKEKETDAPPAAATVTETAKRTRLSLSKDKKLAYLVLSMVAILEGAKVAAALTEPEKAKVVAAKATANEIGGGDVLKPVTDRIVAIQGELKALDFTADANKAAAQAKELANELDRQIKRKKQIEDMIAG
jgi:hypothetical protein